MEDRPWFPAKRMPWREQPVAVIFFLAIAALVVWAGLKIIAPFLTPILLAAIVVTFTWPVYRRLLAKVGGREVLAASLMLVLVTVVLVLPLFLLVLMLVQQANLLFDAIQRTDFRELFQSFQLEARLASIDSLLPWVNLQEVDLSAMTAQAVQQIPALVAGFGGTFLASLGSVVVGFIFMLLAAFYFYVEGDTIVKEIRDISPLPDEYEVQMLDQFRGVVNATFRGQFLTAVAQGIVTMIGLWIAGVPGPVFWGTVSIVFSLIPMVGAAAVWVPATLYLFAMVGVRGAPLWPAIFLLLWGMAVVSLVDNLIRPWAMRSGTQMSAILLFFSILGGISAFGVVGLILGPLVFALFLTIVRIYKYYFTSGGVGSPGAFEVEPPVESATAELNSE